MKHLRGYLAAAVFAGITYVLSLYGKQFAALIDMVYPYVIRTLEATLATWSSQVDFLLWQFLAVALAVVLIAVLVPLGMWLVFYKLLQVNIPMGVLQFLRDLVDKF